MKLAVSYDKKGNILTLFDPSKTKNKKGFLTYVPAENEQHEIIEVPKEFERKPFTDLPKLLRVKKSGKEVRLEAKK